MPEYSDYGTTREAYSSLLRGLLGLDLGMNNGMGDVLVIRNERGEPANMPYLFNAQINTVDPGNVLARIWNKQGIIWVEHFATGEKRLRVMWLESVQK